MQTGERGDDRGLVLLAGLAGAFGSLDTALNIAFPDLVDDFDLRVTDLQWVVVSFVLSYGVLLLAAGGLGDRVGHGKVMAAGGAGSVVALSLCALAPRFDLFLAGRVVQGVTTAMVMASAPALLSSGRRGGGARAASVFQTAAAGGLAVGPILGGVMVALVGWRGVFWFRVPVALVLLAVAWRAAHTPATSSTPSTLSPPDTATGSASAAVTPAVARPGRAPVIDTDRPGASGSEGSAGLRWLPFVAANGATALISASMFVTWLLVPAFLIEQVGLTAAVGGLVLALSPVGTAAAARGAPAIGARLSPRVAATVGVVLLVGGLGLLVVTASRPSVVAVAVSLLLVGVGLGLFTVPNMAVVMDALPPHRQGVAGSLNLVMRTIGIVAGVAAAGALFDRLSADRSFIPAFQLTVAAAAGVGALTVVTLGRSWPVGEAGRRPSN